MSAISNNIVVVVQVNLSLLLINNPILVAKLSSLLTLYSQERLSARILPGRVLFLEFLVSEGLILLFIAIERFDMICTL